MYSQSIWRKARFLVGFALLMMILVRLVWVQARTYPPSGHTQFVLGRSVAPAGCLPAAVDEGGSQSSVHALTSVPAARRLWARMSCRGGMFKPEIVVRNNQYLLFGTVFASVLLVRIAARSWLVALIAGTILLSRGRLIAAVGDTSWEWLFTCLLTFWTANLAHFLRTGVRASLVSLSGWALLLAALDPAFGALGAAVPLALLVIPLLRRLRMFRGALQARELRHPSGPGLLRSLDSSFAVWASEAWRWREMIIVSAALAALIAASAVALDHSGVAGAIVTARATPPADWWRGWLASALRLVDLDVCVTLGVLGTAAFLPPTRGLPSFWELVWVVATAAVLIGTGVLLVDSVAVGPVADWVSISAYPLVSLSRSSRMLLWLEPALLSLGLVGIFNLGKIANSYLAEVFR